MFDKASQNEPDQFNSLLITNPMFRQMVAIEENHVFSPSLLNSFRVGYNRDNVEFPSGETVQSTQLLPIPRLDPYPHRLWARSPSTRMALPATREACLFRLP